MNQLQTSQIGAGLFHQVSQFEWQSVENAPWESTLVSTEYVVGIGDWSLLENPSEKPAITDIELPSAEVGNERFATALVFCMQPESRE